MERETTAAALQEVLSDRAEREGIVAAYLFGSVARGTARADSDVDVAVLLEKDPPPTLAGLHLDLEGDLEKRLGRSVQLVVLNKAPCDLGVRVIRDGLILLDRDRAKRLRYEVQTRKELWDLEPYLRLYRRMP
jgi:predicted nucleotidyltransferase